VLDHKPRHLIVRTVGEPPALMRRADHIPWALIDYELLMPYPATAG
jgi:hypothetical protein